MFRAAIAAAAFVVLIVMASTGRRTDDPLADRTGESLIPVTAGAVIALDVRNDGKSMRYVKRNGTWWVGDRVLGERAGQHIDQALVMTENAKPVRMFLPEEITQWSADAFGLARDPLMVAAEQRGQPVTVMTFGHPTPDGNLIYMQLNDSPNLYVMSGHLGEAWRVLDDSFNDHQ